mmetsp:Transcript_14122/g.47122  ORF Transcript_14122/g.47122 Transcript_14122/m.47122 type:complete len:281 (+) Transcript_14122:2311-3153(+)
MARDDGGAFGDVVRQIPRNRPRRARLRPLFPRRDARARARRAQLGLAAGQAQPRRRRRVAPRDSLDLRLDADAPEPARVARNRRRFRGAAHGGPQGHGRALAVVFYEYRFDRNAPRQDGGPDRGALRVRSRGGSQAEAARRAPAHGLGRDNDAGAARLWPPGAGGGECAAPARPLAAQPVRRRPQRLPGRAAEAPACHWRREGRHGGFRRRPAHHHQRHRRRAPQLWLRPTAHDFCTKVHILRRRETRDTAPPRRQGPFHISAPRIIPRASSAPRIHRIQ